MTWTAIQTADGERRSIEYEHIEGVTRGMRVVWRLTPVGQATRVSIEHKLRSRRWWLRNRFAEYVVGNLFVMHIADRTLDGIKRHAEALELPRGGS